MQSSGSLCLQFISLNNASTAIITLEWANERISKLEQALQQATAELKARAELSTKWEVKEGEMQKRLDDLEKYVSVLFDY